MLRYPRLSIIVCTHERPVELGRALASVHTQTFKDFELLVVSDGPADEDTKKVCEKWAARMEERGVEMMHMATQERSGYYCVPRNMAMLHARGDYIAHLDDDNVWTPRAVELLVDKMEEGVVWPDFAYGRIRYVFEEGAPHEHAGKPLPEGLAPIQQWNEMAASRLAAGPMSNFVDTSCFVAAKGAYWRLQHSTEMMFNEQYRRFGDWELVTRGVFFAGWRGAHVDEHVLDYYWGTKGQVQLTRAKNEQVAGRVL